MAGLAAAGAAAGTAIMPGIGTAVGGLAGALADTFMGSGGSASPSAPMNSQTAVYGSGLDSSGWAVNFSGVQSASSSPATSSGIGLPAATGGMLGGLGLSSIPSWFWLAAGGLLIWKKFSSKA